MSDVCLVIISVLFPPLPVWIRRGLCSADSLINILLCILGYFPGLIHSWYIIAKYPPYSYNRESKVYYVYQNSTDLESQRPRHEHHHQHTHINEPGAISPHYGATSDTVHQEGTSSRLGAPPAYSEFPQPPQLK